MIEDKAAAGHDRAIAQIEGVKKTNRTDEVARVTKQILIDIRADNFDAPLRGEKTELILFRDTVGKLYPVTDFELRITIVVECQGAEPNLQFDVAFEKMRIIPQNFTFVAAL